MSIRIKSQKDELLYGQRMKKKWSSNVVVVGVFGHEKSFRLKVIFHKASIDTKHKFVSKNKKRDG